MLFVIASILTMTLHEFGHFFTSILVHAQQISIHHNYTSNSSVGVSATRSIIIKITGPLVSLIIGVLFHFICSRQEKRNILFLFLTYMSIFGYIGFFGYLIIAPFTPGGDTGYVFYALGFPIWAMILRQQSVRPCNKTSILPAARSSATGPQSISLAATPGQPTACARLPVSPRAAWAQPKWPPEPPQLTKTVCRCCS